MSSINEWVDDYNGFRDKVISALVSLQSASNKAECCKLGKQAQAYSDLQLQTGKKILFCEGVRADNEALRKFVTSISPEQKRKLGLLQKKCCVPLARFQSFP